ncbi:MAG: hypothetical protein EAZ53_12260 [Bacteroidetes bacterium]|nr:MAG: hypothetical protein EAZ53_12260 [Bacteroidota bacterium]
MIRIGLVGEAPNDTDAIINLLSKRYSFDRFEYITLIDMFHGSELDSKKAKRFLRIEFEDKQPQIVIFIRDLDGLENNVHQLKIRKDYFTNNNSIVNKQGIFLLHIFELEALIFTDIQVFNKKYNTDFVFNGNPMGVFEPKEELKKISNLYTESFNPEIFEDIDFEKALKCKYFSLFNNRLEKLIQSKNSLK